MSIYDGLTMTNGGFVPNDPKSAEQIKNVLNCFVQSVDEGMPIAPEMLKFIRDGVAAYAVGDKTPWKGVRGSVRKGDPRLWGALIFHAHILPNWNAHEGKGIRPSMNEIGKNVNLASETNISKSLSRAEEYLLAELRTGPYVSGRIAGEITTIAISHGLPDGKLIELSGGFYWVTPEQEQQIRDELFSCFKILSAALEQAKKLADMGGVDNLLEAIHLKRQAEIDAHFNRYERAQILFNTLDSAVKQGDITLDEYREAMKIAERTFFFCPRT